MVDGSGVDVDLEQLPAYEEAMGGGGGRGLEGPRIQRPVPITPNGGRVRAAPAANNGVVGLGGEAHARPAERETAPPDGPPPGYEEAQGSVARELERGVEKAG